MSGPMEQAKQQVVDAFEAGAQMAAVDGRFVTLTQSAMGMVGLELARAVLPDDEPRFALPLQVVRGSKVQPGAILVLQERVVWAWSEGLLRPTPRSQDAMTSSIAGVRRFQRKVGRVSADLDAVSFVTAGAGVELVLHSQVAHERSTVALVAALLGGRET